MNHFERLFKTASHSASLILLSAFGTSLCVLGQGVATESAPAEKSLLSDYSDNGYALRQVVPLAKLPPRITFKKGEIYE
jgi:hypothetical protein